MRNWLKFGIFFLLIIACACKSTKKSTSGFIAIDSEEDAISALEAHNLDYEWFAAKGKLNFKSKLESGKASVNIRIKKDSIIWINIRRFGIEFSRMLIQPDSIYVIYRLDKSYEKGTVDSYSKAYGLDFSFDKLQGFFVGNCILPDRETLNIKEENDAWHIFDKQAEVELDYWMDKKTGMLSEHAVNLENRQVNMLFDDYRTLEDDRFFSYSREYFAPFEQEDEAYAKLKISSVEFDVEKKISFEIPAHYTEL